MIEYSVKKAKILWIVTVRLQSVRWCAFLWRIVPIGHNLSGNEFKRFHRLWPIGHNFGQMFLRWITQSVPHIRQILWRVNHNVNFDQRNFNQPLSVRNSVANRIFDWKIQNFQSKFTQFPIVSDYVFCFHLP